VSLWKVVEAACADKFVWKTSKNKIHSYTVINQRIA